MSRAAQIEETAARWLLRQEEPGWAETDQAGLEAWLNADPEHRVAFWRLESAWTQADRLRARRVADQTGGLMARPGPARRRVVLGLAGAAAGVVAAVSAFGAMTLLMASGEEDFTAFMTDIGEHRSVPLADGSLVELNTATRVRAQVRADARRVWLEEGEAYFDVVHDPERPFLVHAGDRVITVLGTRFSVWRDGERLRVAVAEGRVRIDDASATVAAQTTGSRIVEDGAIVVADGASTMIATRSAERVAETLGWREGQLVFERTTLADAVAEFNRYNRKQLVIADPAVAEVRISGRFEAANVDVFVRLLQRGFNFRIEDDGRTVMISE